ncbi:MAG: serine/threonine-protein kinase [Phycisphaerales bacterium JB063]
MPDPREIQVNRIKEITCTACKHVIDITPYKPLAKEHCPQCSASFQVPGQIGQYVLFKRIAAGAMGSVYTAYDEVLARQVALKIVSAPPSKDDDLYQGALREARVQATINHPNVAQVYAMSEDMGQPYIIMELIDGGCVLDLIREGGAIDEVRALQIGIDTASGLFAAQKLGLMHRDIKPGNLLLDREGRAKIIDFGLAERTSKQVEGKVLGSPYYMPPEIAKGKTSDHRADIYSLGAALYHMLVGTPAFKRKGDSPRDVVLRRFKVPPPDPCDANPAVHQETGQLIRHMLALDPDARPADYPQLIRTLRQTVALLQRDQATPTAEPEVDPLQALSDAVNNRR